MDLSIVIVNWNARDLLARCLQTIRDTADPLRVEIFVVDNNSADGSEGMVRGQYPEAVWIPSGGNHGFARANNLALPRVTSPLVLFLNPDTELKRGALAGMVTRLKEDPSIGALGCKILDGDGRVQELGLQLFPSPFTELLKLLFVSNWSFRQVKKFLPYHDPEKSGYVAKLFGACLLVRTEILREHGSFDERFFMYCEDVDLCYRIAAAGWKLYYQAEVEIIHVGAACSTRAPGAFSVLMTCESFAKLMRKYYGRFGVAGYRLVMLGGAQVRLLMLALLRVVRWFRAGGPVPDHQGSVRKYVTISKWSLGLAKPSIRN